MKKIKFLSVLVIAGIFSSCLDTEEKIIINADNSGTYSMTYDLGRVLSMAATMGASSDSGKIKEKKDTTIYLKDLVAAADNFTDAEKALYSTGSIIMSLDEEKGEMKIVMSNPFKNPAELTFIKNNFLTAVNKLKALEKAMGKGESVEEENMKIEPNTANPFNDQFTFVATPGSISNSITDMNVFKAKVAGDSTLGMMTQMTSMAGDFNFRTIIVVPKTVKKYDGPGSTISTDKKTLTFVTSLKEMMEHPEKISYTVSY